MIVANVNQSHAAVAQLLELIKNEKGLYQLVNQDIKAGTKRLLALNAAADGLQLSSDHRRDTPPLFQCAFQYHAGRHF
jgi:hypothetical protein